MFLTLNKQLRIETDSDVISNLVRKGWCETTQPVFDSNTHTCIWNNGEWKIVEIGNELAIAKAYQLRAWLIRQNIDLDTIPQIINSIDVSETQKKEMLMRWEYVTDIPSDHPLVLLVAKRMGLDPKTIWNDIININ